jgi:hypothetical protein
MQAHFVWMTTRRIRPGTLTDFERVWRPDPYPGIVGRPTPVGEAEHVGRARPETVGKSGELQEQRADGPQRVVSESLDCKMTIILVLTIAAISVRISSIL